MKCVDFVLISWNIEQRSIYSIYGPGVGSESTCQETKEAEFDYRPSVNYKVSKSRISVQTVM